MSSTPRHCVMIPFLNRHQQVAQCLDTLLANALPETVFLLIDDGSTPQAIRSTVLQPALSLPNVELIHHPDNYGVSAARNSGLHWCRQHDMAIVIMLDSDCVPEANLITEHLRLHAQHPEAVCIGGQIIGEGEGLWATLDGWTSWVHATPHRQIDPDVPEFRAVRSPYHLATTNFSVKLDRLPARDFVFDERLVSGEDCLLVRELRKSGLGVYFSSTPRAFHHDRDTFTDVFRHHYEWGHHQYFIQLGGDLSPRCFDIRYRILFVLLFTPLLPWFSLAGALLNCRALWSNHRRGILLLPLIYLLWLGKGVAVLEAAIRPLACLKPQRPQIHYEEALLDE